MKPNCSNADCYLLPKYTVLSVDTYGCWRGTGLTDLQVTAVRLVLLLDHLGSKLILTICNQFIATPFSHNTTLCCKNTYQTAVTAVFSATAVSTGDLWYRLSVLLEHLWIDLKYSRVVIHMTHATKAKCSVHKLTVTLLQGPLAVKWYISLRCCNLL